MRFLLGLIALGTSISISQAAPLNTSADALNRALGHCADPCILTQSNGGRIIDFEDAADEIKGGARSKLVIDGYCASACMVLADRARPRVCITGRAVFAFHKTNKHYPIPLRSDLDGWINRRGGYPEFTGTPGIMSYESAQKFWPTCKKNLATQGRSEPLS